MGWTKRQIVETAFEEIGLASYAFDLQPEQLQSALRRLDAMMGTWSGDRIHIGYSLPGDPSGSNLDDDSGIGETDVEAVYTNLAIALAGRFGRPVSADLNKRANAAKRQVIARTAVVPQAVTDPRKVPAGAGNKKWNWGFGPFLGIPTQPLTDGDGPEIEVQ